MCARAQTKTEPLAALVAADPEVIELLWLLAETPGNTLVIVSSRQKHILEGWMGDMPCILVAEHGAYVRWGPGEAWECQLADQDESWKDKVAPLFQYYTERTPGSLFDTKDASVAWHWRDTDQGHGECQARELQSTVAQFIHRMPVIVVPGDCKLEVSEWEDMASMV